MRIRPELFCCSAAAARVAGDIPTREKHPDARETRDVPSSAVTIQALLDPYGGTGSFCVGAAACPRPAANRSVYKKRAANLYKATNLPHDPVLPPAGEDVSAADR